MVCNEVIKGFGIYKEEATLLKDTILKLEELE